MKFRFMMVEKANYPVALMCRVLGVSRSGFYAFEARPKCARKLRDEALAIRIRETHQQSRAAYGSPRIHRALKADGCAVSRKRVARLMREGGMRGRKRRRFVRSTTALPDVGYPDNLLKRQFTTQAPNQVWVADVTPIWTLEGWLHLAAILDLYSRRVVGWDLSPSPSVDLCASALKTALRERRPKGGLVHHSDRGVQYTSRVYQQLLLQHGVAISMSRRGNCWDNAVAESFFATLKVELTP